MVALRTLWPDLYRGGLTLEQIAMRAGVTSQTVGNHLRRVGVTLRPKGMRRGSHIVARQQAAALPAPIDPPLEYPVGDDDGPGYP